MARSLSLTGGGASLAAGCAGWAGAPTADGTAVDVACAGSLLGGSAGGGERGGDRPCDGWVCSLSAPAALAEATIMLSSEGRASVAAACTSTLHFIARSTAIA